MGMMTVKIIVLASLVNIDYDCARKDYSKMQLDSRWFHDYW